MPRRRRVGRLVQSCGYLRLLTAALAAGVCFTAGSIGAARAATTKAPKTVVQPGPEIEGVPVTGGAGVTESVDQLMEREASVPFVGRLVMKPEHEAELELKNDPNAPAISSWPPFPGAKSVAPSLFLPQTTGVSFQAIFLNPPTFNESGNIPPDSMGDVGPTQILAAANGRFKVFDKTGVLGALNVSDTTFWASLSPSGGTSDPEVRYDRLSGRWFVLAIDLAATNNKILIAVSSGPTITSTSSFTFFSFAIGTPSATDATSFCDYPSLGVDANAVYTGCNMFASTGAFRWTSAFVIRKSSITGGGPIVVTGFGNITTGTTAGPYAPRGVDNDDPQATQGYIVGTDVALLSRIQIRRVSTPGGTPTLSANITLTVATTSNLNRQLSPGNTTQTNGIDASDQRLFMASIHKNKLTGVSSLWTAQSVETDASCVALASGVQQRLGSRWYEIGNLTTTPSVTQFGTLCTAGSSATANSLRGFLYPSVAENGQGHMALGATYASSTANENPGVAAAGRLRTDTAGVTQAATVVLAGTGTYRLCDGSGGACPRNRWGDYSFTDVDPNDDQTMWTFQEYALDATGSGFAGNWAVRAVQLKAPPPATPASVSAAVCIGLSSASVTVTGTSSSGSEFFDPGADPGGPGYTNHIAASVSGGVTVNSVAIVVPGSPSTTPVTQVTLSVNTTAAAPGTKNITITNPDGQSATGNGILTVNAPAGAPAAGNDGPLCAGATLHLTASTIAGATYSWTGPNGFTSTLQNPTIANVQAVNAGTYSVTATTAGCAAGPAGQTTVSVTANGGACNDGNACTQTDACSGGSCVGGNPVICTPLDPCHVAGTCNPGTGSCSNPSAPNGTSCSDGNGCTQSDTCQSGTCQSGPPVTCTPLDACHVAGTCSPGTGTCSNPNASDGTSCSDGNACTQTDACQSGTCVGSNPVTCTPLNACHVAGTCNPGTGTCTNPNAPDGTSCSDGNDCTQTDACQSGSCTGSNPVVCMALDACHLAGSCVPATGLCTNPSAPAGTACGDGSSSACDSPDTCNGSGSCTANHASDGTQCGDTGTQCINQDTCLDGACLDNGYVPSGIACGDGSSSACDSPDTCNGSGSCSANNASDGTLCGDTGTPCTNQDTCLDGACRDNGYQPSGTACGDGTSSSCDSPDTCNGSGSCSANHAADGTLCGDTGTSCTNQDTCLGGACHDNGFQPSGTACGDGTSSACDSPDSCNGSGSCAANHAADGTLCGDTGTQCTNQDTCLGGACHDNGYHPSGTACGDGTSSACDNPDACNGTGACSPNHAADGTLCGDTGTQCTNQDTCLGGACHDNGYQPSGASCGSPADTACDHADTCDGSGACQVNVAPSGTPCSDGLGCTAPDTCNGSGACTSTPVDCNDGSVCSVDTCVEPSGACDHSQASGLCSIAGLVRYYRNHITSTEPSTKPVPDEDVSRASSTEPTQVSTTNASGQYGFTSEAGDITLTPQPVRLITDENECRSAISASDASLIARASVLLTTLTGNQSIAADVTNNGTVSSFDAALVSQRAVASSCTAYEFPVRTATGSDWSFRPVSRNFTPLQGGEDYNFIGIVYGDVTGNWVAPAFFSQGEAQPGESVTGAPAPAADGDLADETLIHTAGAVVQPSASASGRPGAVLYLVSGPHQNPDGTWDVVLGLQGSDGVLGLDMRLAYDLARIHLEGVQGTGLGATLTLVGNGVGGTYFIAAYGTSPLQGSGALIKVIYTPIAPVDGVPFSVGAQANEGKVPISWSPGVPGGARDPKFGADR